VWGIALWWSSAAKPDASGSLSTPSTRYVGERTCASCHQAEVDKWRRSDHALAMQEVSEQTVLGDFRDVDFSYGGVTSTFFKKEGRFFVRTDGPDGELHDYQITYTFGVRPLQQYLIAFPDGRMQPLGIAWDSRPAHEGGQRWFHLYPDQNVTAIDPRHWTHRNQNWNSMCASCHSTNLQKNYDLAADRFATTWSDINVSCEACHGPGSNHVAWAEARSAGGVAPDPTKGLIAGRRASEGGHWEPAARAARWIGPPRRGSEVETCGTCHTRSRLITSRRQPGGALLDTQVPALLEAGLYHADGQILDEVFEYGSFTQSRMHRAGVTCSDCHDPHTAKLRRGPGNATCSTCHLPATFDSESHHRHKAGTEAALCVSCHMPKKTYMVVDDRRDHSFRVPRPDLSIASGAPNACTTCHTTRSAQWSADAVARWYGPNRRQEPHYLTAIDAGRRGVANAEPVLASAATDRQVPPIAQATILTLLADYLSPASLPAMRGGLTDADPLVRAASVRGLTPLPPQDRAGFAADLLRDPVRAVRIEAARVLAGTPTAALSSRAVTDLERALGELVDAELASAERPESHLNLGALNIQLGRPNEAEASLKMALRLDPRFVPAMINLADLYRSQNRDGDGEALLLRAIAIAPDRAEAVHSLGLLRVRQGRQSEALTLLRQAASLEPGAPRYGYTHALALQSSGDLAGAGGVLEDTHRRHPTDYDTLLALVHVQRDLGNVGSARAHAEKLLALAPGDAEAVALVQQLRVASATSR
jgi:Flp pilus assembly protein TadD